MQLPWLLHIPYLPRVTLRAAQLLGELALQGETFVESSVINNPHDVLTLLGNALAAGCSCAASQGLRCQLESCG